MECSLVFRDPPYFLWSTYEQRSLGKDRIRNKMKGGWKENDFEQGKPSENSSRFEWQDPLELRLFPMPEIKALKKKEWSVRLNSLYWFQDPGHKEFTKYN